MWIGVMYSNTLSAHFSDTRLAYSLNGTIHASDFLVYYNDAVMSWQCLHEKINVWDPQVQNAFLQKLVPDIELKKTFYSEYPPILMVLVMPLSLFPLKVALGIFEILGMIGIMFSVY